MNNTQDKRALEQEREKIASELQFHRTAAKEGKYPFTRTVHASLAKDTNTRLSEIDRELQQMKEQGK